MCVRVLKKPWAIDCINISILVSNALTHSQTYTHTHTHKHTHTHTHSLTLSLFPLSSSPFPPKGMHRAHLCKFALSNYFSSIFCPTQLLTIENNLSANIHLIFFLKKQQQQQQQRTQKSWQYWFGSEKQLFFILIYQPIKSRKYVFPINEFHCLNSTKNNVNINFS